MTRVDDESTRNERTATGSREPRVDGRGESEQAGRGRREPRADGGETDHPPRLVYDDDCGFCTWCVERALDRGDFEPVGFSELSPDQRARLPEEYETSAHLLTDDAVYSAGEAVEQTVVRLYPELEPLVEELRAFETYRELREGLYRWGADRRSWWGKIVRACPPARRPGDRTE
ncbi:DCC1-like thiol-disulfide oxidoreductase family protein [Halarchaeum nitratireducens]|uniref:DUF393 domain-containing protein n=1 Tax=Halarchaeum nitratireducens TaxID=489913 RepID=A0A830G9H0_9EURY|nr:DCC1-like thiol-disulfide oxidoreductase family protein [Halarchaeum nitratireducens]GGN11418.1 hypothetical protein GCM10009021_09200 [Halarchaeum nitratireducens]